MASVTSSQIVSDRPQSDGSRYVRYRYDLLDNNNGNHVQYYGPKLVPAGFDAEADMLSRIPTILADRKSDEVLSLISAIEDDPLHIDMGGWFEKATPNWGTWDEQWTAVAKYFFSLADQLELIPFSTCFGRVSNTDKRNLLGIDNQTVTDMGADMQTAIDTRNSLDAYSPYFDEAGNLA